METLLIFFAGSAVCHAVARSTNAEIADLLKSYAVAVAFLVGVPVLLGVAWVALIVAAHAAP